MAGLVLISILLAQSASGTVAGVADFPVAASGFDQNAVVTINASTLESLQDEQLRALLYFAGSCGRVLLVDVSPSIEEIFRNDAACDGRYLRTARSTDDLQARSLELKSMPGPPRITEIQLNSLAEAASKGKVNIQSLALFWFAYISLVLILTLSVRTRLIGLIFSIAATALIHIVWPPSTTRTLVAWAEAEAGDRVAAFFSLERETTYLSGQFTTELDRHRGSFDLNPSLGFEFHENAVEICNHGSGPSVISHVYWHGTIHNVPSIDPGTSWSTDDESKADEKNLGKPELALFARRSQQHELTLFRTLPVTGGSNQGWLLQYANPSQEIRSCDR